MVILECLLAFSTSVDLTDGLPGMKSSPDDFTSGIIFVKSSVDDKI